MKLAIALILCLGLCGALARGPRDRSLEVKQKAHALSIRARSMDKETKTRNDVRFDVTTNGFPRFRARFFHKDTDTVANFKYRFGILGVIEYSGDISQPFNMSAVLPNRFMLLGKSQQWTEMQLEDGDEVKTASTSITDNTVSPAAAIKLTVRVAPKYHLAGNTTLGPNKLKWDMEITNFPYSDVENTHIGILCNVQSSAKRHVRERSEEEPDLDEGEIEVEGGGKLAYQKQAWSQNGTSEGWTRVRLSDLVPDNWDYSAAGSDDDDRDSSESSNLVVFFFEDTSKPEKIVYDPEVGFAANLIDNGASLHSVSLFLVALLALLATAASKF